MHLRRVALRVDQVDLDLKALAPQTWTPWAGCERPRRISAWCSWTNVEPVSCLHTLSGLGEGDREGGGGRGKQRLSEREEEGERSGGKRRERGGITSELPD